jgi:glutaminyl-peptide cyclotransferase
MQYASHVVKKVWDTALRLGYSSYFVYDQTNPITDDHYYINTLADIPAIDIIHYDPATKYHFPSVWHTHNDNIQNIDPQNPESGGADFVGGGCILLINGKSSAHIPEGAFPKHCFC